MKVGFVSARSASMKDGRFSADAGLGRLIDAVRNEAESFTCALSIHGSPLPFHDHLMSVDSREVVALPEMISFRQAFMLHSACLEVIREVEAKSDVVIVQTPFAAASALAAQRRPRVYHVCADVFSIVAASRRYRGLSRPASVVAALCVDRWYRYLFAKQRSRLVTNGEALLARYPHARGRAVVSTSLLPSDFDRVQRARTDRKFRVLFVGHIRPEKGLEVLLDAFDIVARRMDEVELHIVGPSFVSQEDAAENLTKRLAHLQSAERVSLVGTKAFGPDLFQCFADADVLVLPSFSEGTPRVLVEARAFGCPVIASDVGGIPTSVEHGVDGLLVPRRDAAMLAGAILRLARDEHLRRRLVETGQSRARRNTVDRFAAQLLDEATAALGRRDPALGLDETSAAE